MNEQHQDTVVDYVLAGLVVIATIGYLYDLWATRRLQRHLARYEAEHPIGPDGV